MVVELLPAAGGFGGGAVMGGIIGYSGRKLTRLAVKAAILLAGIQLLVFTVAKYYGVVTVDWDGLQTFLGSIAAAGSEAGTAAAEATPTLFDTALAFTPIGGGLILGALIGFKQG